MIMSSQTEDQLFSDSDASSDSEPVVRKKAKAKAKPETKAKKPRIIRRCESSDSSDSEPVARKKVPRSKAKTKKPRIIRRCESSDSSDSEPVARKKAKAKTKTKTKTKAKPEIKPETKEPDGFFSNAGKDKYMETVEVFDPRKLQFVLDNFKDYKDKMRWRERYDTIDPFKIIKRYLHRSRGDAKACVGRVRVNYRQKTGFGRFFAINSMSLQTIPREIRHTISRDFYDDLDMVNAHPQILLWMCQEFGFACEALEHYVNDREPLLKQIMIDGKPAGRDKAKQIYLALTNGGVKDYALVSEPSEHLTEYRDEMLRIHKFFAKTFSGEYTKFKAKALENGKKHNLKASFMNSLMCEMENRILMAVYDFLGRPKDVVLCFDGLMLRKGFKYDVAGAVDHVKKVIGIHMPLKVKTMDEHWCIPEAQLKPYEYFRLDYFNDFDNMLSNAAKGEAERYIYPEWAEEWVHNAISVLKRSGEQVFVTLEHDIDRLTGEESKKHTLVKEKDLMRTLDVRCNIKNPEWVFGGSAAPYTHRMLGLGTPSKPGYVKWCLLERRLPLYKGLEFHPYLRRKGLPRDHGKLNLFSGFPLEIVEAKQKDFTESLFYRHLATDFFNGDPVELNHFLDHIADMIQCPDKVRGVAHLFYSVQGTGKGMLAAFMSRMLGSEHCVTIKDFDRYMEKFNLAYTNKLLKVFEELPERGGAFNKSDKLKSHIDQREENVEPKGFKMYSINHFARYWFFTNNENTLYIEGSDRRYTLHKISSEHANDKAYFAPIWAELEDTEFLKGAFEYLATRKYDVLSTMKALSTKYKRSQKEANLPKGIKFLIEWIQGNYDEAKDTDLKIASKTLCNAYSAWCEDGYGSYHKGSFLTQIARIGIDKPRPLRLDGARTYCFKLNIHRVQESLREFLKDPEFSFEWSEDDVE